MKRIRVGNGCGFWGDSIDAPIELAREGRLDYLTLEYLAELTMSILALQKRRDPNAGYATDFLDVLERLVPILKGQPNLKIVTNAGGMNPAACAIKARAILQAAGLSGTIAVVEGDDLFPRIDQLVEAGEAFADLDTGRAFAGIRPNLVSANAYLGAEPIAGALRAGARVVVTGRVADASLTVGPAMAEFGWTPEEVDRISAATIAGHLIECGAQATGGIATHWQEFDIALPGYPIAEIDADGTFRITKPEGTGGAVNLETIGEQLLYEVGDPANYLTPDVVSDFTSISLHQAGRNVVEVRNAKGKRATPYYKVSMAYRNGFASSGTLFVPTEQGAEAAGEMVLARLRRAGFEFARSHCEILGYNGPSDGPPGSFRPCMMRISVHDPNRAAVERFTRELAPLATSGPQGVSGYATGRPAVREVFAYWPTLVAKSRVEGRFSIL